MCVCHCCCCCCFPLSLSVLFNLHLAAGLKWQHLSFRSSTAPQFLLSLRVHSSLLEIRKEDESIFHDCLDYMELQLGNLHPLRCKTEPKISTPSSNTWGGANFSIVIEQHKDTHSVFPVHVSGGFKPVRTSYFLCPRFGVDAKMMKKPVEPSRLFSGVSSNAVYLMMSLIYFQRCAGQIHICCSLTFTVE